MALNAHRNREWRPERPSEGDLLGRYLAEIAATPLLTAAEETELALTIEGGLAAQHHLDEGTCPAGATPEELAELAAAGRRAKDAFIRANMRLVVAVARRFPADGLSLLDLIQEGTFGLIRAVEGFDLGRGFKFSTYATWWIRQAIGLGVARSSRTVRVSSGTHADVNRLKRVRRELAQRGTEPTPERLAAELGLTVERVNELDRWDLTPMSLDAQLTADTDARLGDVLVDESALSPEQSAVLAEQIRTVNELLAQLEPRAAEVLRARYGFTGECSIKQLAARLHLSPRDIREIEAAALRRMRDLAARNDLGPLLAA